MLAEAAFFKSEFRTDSKSKEKKNSRKKTHASVTVTVVRDRKIRTVLRTHQIPGFVTVPAWKKKISYFISSFQLKIIGGVNNKKLAWMSGTLSEYELLRLKNFVAIETVECSDSSIFNILQFLQCVRAGHLVEF